MPQLRVVVRGACLALTVACAACTTASRAPGLAAHGPDVGHAVITVGPFDTKVELDGRAPRAVAERWLQAHGLAGPGLGSS
jgi:hypothetical protein